MRASQFDIFLKTAALTRPHQCWRIGCNTLGRPSWSCRFGTCGPSECRSRSRQKRSSPNRIQTQGFKSHMVNWLWTSWVTNLQMGCWLQGRLKFDLNLTSARLPNRAKINLFLTFAFWGWFRSRTSPLPSWAKLALADFALVTNTSQRNCESWNVFSFGWIHVV